jgi:hypothetical protein
MKDQIKLIDNPFGYKTEEEQKAFETLNLKSRFTVANDWLTKILFKLLEASCSTELSTKDKGNVMVEVLAELYVFRNLFGDAKKYLETQLKEAQDFVQDPE